ncbi:MAG: hypothetical protein NVS3B21_03140 [Acidimicrobiales bacterium]
MPIFVIHRVRPTPLRPNFDPDALDITLQRLRNSGCVFVPLHDVVAAVTEGRRLPDGAVAFTADDGYVDQAEVLAPVFIRHRCPLTIFVISAFLDRQWVPWWDRIEHALVSTERRSIEMSSGETTRIVPIGTVSEKLSARHELVAAFKALPSSEAEEYLARLYGSLSLEVPSAPFDPYEPMSWSDARRLEADELVTFGPHTMRHPILARSEPASMAAEIDGSWDRLATELSAPVKVFCYPVGGRDDFGVREERILADRTYLAAVSVNHRQAVVAPARAAHALRFRMGRIPLHEEPGSLLAAAAGIVPRAGRRVHEPAE